MNQTIRQLTLPRSGKINQVIHCSDIHIRKGDSTRSRKTEYLTVFNNFFEKLKSIKSVQDHTAIIVCTGDIFHDYDNFNNNTLDMFHIFVEGLANLAPTYLIQGNHDFKSDRADETDTIATGVRVPRPNIEYLAATGIYQAGDVIFGLVAEHDVLDPCTTSGKQVDELPKFPNHFPPGTKHKLALFHGTVKSALLDNYREDTLGYPLEWFQGYDAVLLGHIHLQQLHNTNFIENDRSYPWIDGKLPWGYPGSLIQQNWGEDIHGHGYIIWDLLAKTATLHHVYNPVGRIYAKYFKNESIWKTYFDRKWTDIDNVLQLPIIPKNMLLVTIKDKYSAVSLESLTASLEKYQGGGKYKITNILAPGSPEIEIYDIDFEHLTKDTLVGEIEEINSTQTFLHYIQQNSENLPIEYQTLITKPETALIDINNLPICVQNNAQQRNIEINKFITDLNNAISAIHLKFSRQSLRLLHLEWDWMLGYGENNWYDFTKLDGTIGIVEGKNDAGKSSLMEIICFAIFGAPFNSRHDTGDSKDIVNLKKPHGTVAKTVLKFTLDSQTYVLLRKFSPNSINSGLQKTIELFTISNDNTLVELQKDSSVAKWIEENIGNVSSFLLSCMVTQNLDEDFFSKSLSQQEDTINKMLNLDYITSLKTLLHKTQLAYKSIRDNMKTAYQQLATTVIPRNIDNLPQYHENIQQLEQQASKIEQCIATKNSVLDEFEFPQNYKTHLSLPIEHLVAELVKIEDLYNHTYTPTLSLDNLQDKLIESKSILNPISDYVDTTVGKNYTEIKLALDNLTVVPKPNNNESKIRQDISTFEKTYDVPSMNQHCIELDNNEKQLNTLSSKLESSRKELDTHQRNFPQRPTRTMTDFTKWKKNNTKLAKIDPNEILLLTEFCKNNPLIKPSTNSNIINNLKSTIRLAKTQLSNPMWIDCDDSQFIQESQSIIDRFNQLEQTLNVHQTERNAIQAKINDVQRTLSSLTKELQDITPASQPIIHISAINDWYAEFNRLDALFPTYQEIANTENKLMSAQSSLKSLQNDLANYQESTKQTPFNPDCWACQKQTWKQHLDHLENNVTLQSNEVDKLKQTYLEISQIIALNDKQTVHSKLNTYLQMKNQLSLYNEYRTSYNLYQTYLEHSTPIKQKISSLESELVSLTVKNQTCTKLVTDTESKITDLRRLRNDVITCQNNRSTWRSNLDVIQNEETVHINFQTINEKHTQLNNITKYQQEHSFWNNELDIINKFSAWQQELVRLQNLVANYDKEVLHMRNVVEKTRKYVADKQTYDNNVQEVAEWKIWHEMSYLKQKYIATYHHYLILDYQKNIEAIYTRDKLKAQTEVWKNLIYIKPHYDQKNSSELELKKIQQQIKDLDKQISQLEIIQKMIDENDQQKNHLLTCIDEFDGKRDSILQLERLTSNYKLWIYKEKFIPKIITDTNRIAHLLNAGREYNLDADIFYNKDTDKITTHWSISDGTCKTRVKRNGGFRSFLFGLAMRITLSYLGGNTVKCDQLFLDEGFVGADCDNLELVPDFLRNLLNIYRSILVVSHLDTLKYASDIRASINRIDKISQLQFGQNIHYPFKTRGRKPRNTTSTNVNINQLDSINVDSSNHGHHQTTILADTIEDSTTLSFVNSNNGIINTVLDEPNSIQLISGKCQSTAKTTGKQCTRNPLSGTSFCKTHSL